MTRLSIRQVVLAVIVFAGPSAYGSFVQVAVDLGGHVGVGCTVYYDPL